MLKKITELSTLKQGVIAFTVFFVIATLLPVFNAPPSTEAAFAAATFIFAILAGFFISRLYTRYSVVGKAASDEDGLWASIFEYSKSFSQEIQHQVVVLIDEHYRTIYDRDLTKNYEAGTPIINRLYDVFTTLKDQDLSDMQTIALDKTFDALTQIEIVRNESQTAGFEKMTHGMWAVTISLLAVVIVSLYLLRDSSLIFNLTAAVFSTGGVIVLLLMRDLDDFKIGEFMLAEESGQQVFDLIGQLRYYHERYLNQSRLIRVPKHIKEYRVGRHEVGEKPNIEIVKNKNYDSNFKI